MTLEAHIVRVHTLANELTGLEAIVAGFRFVD